MMKQHFGEKNVGKTFDDVGFRNGKENVHCLLKQVTLNFLHGSLRILFMSFICEEFFDFLYLELQKDRCV